MVKVAKGGGRASPPSPAWANFTRMTECTPESDCCYSVYSMFCTIAACIFFPSQLKDYSTASVVERIILNFRRNIHCMRTQDFRRHRRTWGPKVKILEQEQAHLNPTTRYRMCRSAGAGGEMGSLLRYFIFVYSRCVLA
jgi:hypothetical protein